MRNVIQQSVVLPAPAEKLFEAYLDSATHAAITGFPVAHRRRSWIAIPRVQQTVERPDSGGCSATARSCNHGGRSSFTTTIRIPTLILSFTPDESDARHGRIDLVHLDVPDHDYPDVVEGWHKHYWNPWRTYLQNQERHSAPMNTRSANRSRRRELTCWLVILLVAFATSSHAAEFTTIRLWEKGAPGTPAYQATRRARALRENRRPSRPTTSAIIILPGGGYAGLAMTYEGLDVGDWFGSLGVTPFVLKYRMQRHRPHAPDSDDGRPAGDPHRSGPRRGVEDRSRRASACWAFPPAGTWPARWALTSMRATRKAPIRSSACSSRPDFLILCYPVISMTAPTTHRGSVENLLGKSPDPKLLENLSNETQVTPQTPPTFIFQTSEDTGVPAENAVAFYLALHKAGVPGRDAHLPKRQARRRHGERDSRYEPVDHALQRVAQSTRAFDEAGRQQEMKDYEHGSAQ